MSWGTMVIITSKENITEEEIGKAVSKFEYGTKVEEHEYGSVESFRDSFTRCKQELQQWGAEKFLKRHKGVSPETIKNGDLHRYIEESSYGNYRVEGDTVYSIINDKDFLFDGWSMPEPVEQYFLFTKDKKKVSSCKTTDWDLIGRGATVFRGIIIDDQGNAKGAGKERPVEKMVYDLIYDYDNDSIEGINYFNVSDEEYNEWDNNFDKHAAKYVSENTYAYIIKYHF